MANKEFNPNFKTPLTDYSKEELNKLNSNGLVGNLEQELHDESRADIVWEAEQLAKSYGIYLEFDRQNQSAQKDWIYMIRVTIPGGGPILKRAWQILDDISELYAIPPTGKPSLRLTTRQNLQFHWIRKKDLLKVIQEIVQSGFMSLNGCGDNTRNTMACPVSQYSDLFNANQWAQKVAKYFELPNQPFIQIFELDPDYLRTDDTEKKFSYGPALLNRKFKIAFSTVYRDQVSGEIKPDNCVEALTNDVAISPVFKDEKLEGFQIAIGGGQGERNGKPTMATLARPFAFVTTEELIPTLDAIVAVHQEWGDRQNRHWARLKYVIKKMGLEWFQEEVGKILPFALGKPNLEHDCGPRLLHYGWHSQGDSKLWTYGMFVENGRIVDSSDNGRLKSAIRHQLENYPVTLTLTAKQDLLFNDIPTESKEAFEKDLTSFGYGQRHGSAYSELRLRSGACVGRTTCRLAYTESEQFEPLLIDQLEKLGWGDLDTSIGVTGCERQCYRPATKAIGLVGSGMNLYQVKLMGTEDGRHQGAPVVSDKENRMYLRSLNKDDVPILIDTLFRFYKKNKTEGEEFGYFNLRVGMEAIIEHLKSCPETKYLMEKSDPTENLLARA